jgi:glyoxylase-like metal-dependent hydrolase (beta-lactamase superfamily II)
MTFSEPLWSDPVVEDLGGGIFRIPLPLPNDGLRAVNVYAICDSDGIVLVDGGWALPKSEELLEHSLRSIDRDLSEVTRILVTHVHRDHYTQAISIRNRYGSVVGLGEGEKRSLSQIQMSTTQGRNPGNFEALVRAGAAQLLYETSTDSDLSPSDWADPDEWLTDGQHFAIGARALRAISTPGHTAGHLVYRDDENRLLFAGDHVLPHITPSIGFEAATVPWPLRDYLDSLALMRVETDARLLPAHGPVTGSVHARVEELLKHHAKRLDDAYAIVKSGAGTGLETASIMVWTRRARAFDKLDPFNQRLAVLETTAHLDVLVLQGRLSSAATDGIERYSAD